MRTILELDPELYANLTDHLLPQRRKQEQAAFLFATQERNEQEFIFCAIEARMLGADDFLVQEGDYIELTDATRAALIKHAHDLGASLIELHSHLGPWPAAFSPSDRSGLRETVAHMWWRLKSRPYLALVVTATGFDALVWLDTPITPCALDSLVVGPTLLKPTNLSLDGWT